MRTWVASTLVCMIGVLGALYAFEVYLMAGSREAPSTSFDNLTCPHEVVHCL